MRLGFRCGCWRGRMVVIPQALILTSGSGTGENIVIVVDRGENIVKDCRHVQVDLQRYWRGNVDDRGRAAAVSWGRARLEVELRVRKVARLGHQPAHEFHEFHSDR